MRSRLVVANAATPSERVVDWGERLWPLRLSLTLQSHFVRRREERRAAGKYLSRSASASVRSCRSTRGRSESRARHSRKGNSTTKQVPPRRQHLTTLCTLHKKTFFRRATVHFELHRHQHQLTIKVQLLITSATCTSFTSNF